MKKQLFFFLSLLTTGVTSAQIAMAPANDILPGCTPTVVSDPNPAPLTDKEQIEEVIKRFMRGGDESDTVLLAGVLHPQFRVVVNQGVFGLENAMVLNRPAYFQQIAAKKWGGVPRQVNIVSIANFNSVASAEVKTSSERSDITSYLHLVKGKDGSWSIINDTPFPVPKTPK